MVQVLDHGHVRLVDHMGDDLSIVRNARVSYDAEWRTGEDAGKDEKLINYLLKNKHTSPFEAVKFTFDVKAPIFVFRQWHRHRTWSFNEISARYAELPEEYYLPEPEQITTQATGNKQMRTHEQHPRSKHWRALLEMSCYAGFQLYRRMLADDVPRELARGVLPVFTYSHMFATVDLHNLFKFLELRLHEHAQYEIRVYAEAMLELIEPIVPVAVAAFRANRGVRTGKWLCKKNSKEITVVGQVKHDGQEWVVCTTPNIVLPFSIRLEAFKETFLPC